MARSVIIRNKESNEIQFPETLSLLVRDVSTGNTVAEDIQTIQSSIATKENTSNKVTSISSSSMDTQYPSAKAVYDTTSALAPKASPALTGTPTAPTAAAGTNTT